MIPFRSFSAGGFQDTWIVVEFTEDTRTPVGSPGTRLEIYKVRQWCRTYPWIIAQRPCYLRYDCWLVFNQLNHKFFKEYKWRTETKRSFNKFSQEPLNQYQTRDLIKAFATVIVWIFICGTKSLNSAAFLCQHGSLTVRDTRFGRINKMYNTNHTVGNHEKWKTARMFGTHS